MRINHIQRLIPIDNPNGNIHESSSPEFINQFPPDVYNTLILNQIEDSWFSQPFNVNFHESFKWIQLNLSSQELPVIIGVHELMKLMTLPLGKPAHVSIPNPIAPILNRLPEKEDTKSYLRIPTSDSNNIFKYFQEVCAIGGKPIDFLDSTAKLEYTQILTMLCNNFSQAISALNKDNNPTNAASLDSALTQWIVIPTFLLLFPVSNWRTIKEKNNLHVFIRQRYEAICAGFKNGDKHLLVEVKHLADTKKNPSKASMTYKAAEDKVYQSKFATATNMLMNAKKLGLGTSMLNDQTTFNSLLALHPSSITRSIVNSDFEAQSSSMPCEIKPSSFSPDEVIFATEEFKNFAGKIPSELHNNILKNKSYFTEENVQKAFLANSRKGTSPGIDKLSAQFIYNLIRLPDGASKLLLRSIIALFNSWVNAPSYIWQFITVASINGLPKPDNGVRPIANGCQWRKIWMSVILNHFRSQIQSAYGDTQLSGSPYAAEKFTTRANILYHDLPDHLLFKFDIKNAFNSFLRTAAFEQLLEDIPELGHILIRLFNQELTLLFKDTHFIKSVLGSQQGCIFGPLMFNMAFKRVLGKVNQKCPDSLFNAYMDDNILCVKNDQKLAIEVINVFKSECQLIGLDINFRKSSAVVPLNSHNLASTLIEFGFDKKNVKTRSEDPNIPVGLEVLGCPIGNDSFINNFLIMKFDEYSSLCKAIKNLPHLICQWSLARNSIFCKLIYILRCVAPEYTNNHISCIEDSEWGIIEEIAKFKDLDFINPEMIHDLRSRCSKVKIEKGGIGLHDYSTLSKAAYIGAQVSIFDNTLEFIKTYTPKNFVKSKWLDKLKVYVSNTYNIISPFLGQLPISAAPTLRNIEGDSNDSHSVGNNCSSSVFSSSHMQHVNMPRPLINSSFPLANSSNSNSCNYSIPTSIRHCYVKACHNFQAHWLGPSCFDRNSIEYRFIREKADGNCLFSAMSRTVDGTPANQMKFRKAVSEYQQAHHEYFLTKFTEEMCGANHYNNIKKDRVHGEIVDIEAFARIYNFNVILILGIANRFVDINDPETWNSQFQGHSQNDFPPHFLNREDATWNCYLMIGNTSLPNLYDNETRYLFVKKSPDHYDTLIPSLTIPAPLGLNTLGCNISAQVDVSISVPSKENIAGNLLLSNITVDLSASGSNLNSAVNTSNKVDTSLCPNKDNSCAKGARVEHEQQDADNTTSNSTTTNKLVTPLSHSPYSNQPELDPPLNIGDRVWISFNSQEDKLGTLAFMGEVRGRPNFAGIILDEPTGKNNGTLDGTKYFTCPDNHGIFANLDRIFPSNEKSFPNVSLNLQSSKTTSHPNSGNSRVIHSLESSSDNYDDDEVHRVETLEGLQRKRITTEPNSISYSMQATPKSPCPSGLLNHRLLVHYSDEHSSNNSMNVSNSSPLSQNSDQNFSHSLIPDDACSSCLDLPQSPPSKNSMSNINPDINNEFLPEPASFDSNKPIISANYNFAVHQEESIKAIRDFKSLITPKADKVESQWNPFKFQSIINKLLFEIKFQSKGLANNYATNWLLTQPSSARRAVKHSEIKNEIFTRMWRSTLNIDLAPSNLQRKCVCGANLDSKENHLKQCANMQIKNRHDNLVGLLVEYYSSINGQPYKGEVSINSIVGMPNVQEKDFLDINRDMQAALNVPFPKPTSDENAAGIAHVDNIRGAHLPAENHNNNKPSDSQQSCSSPISNSSCNKPAECPILNNLPSGPDRLIYTPAPNSSSTKGTRVDLITMSPNIKVFIDVCISNPKTHHFEQDYLKITNSKLTSAENRKNKLHKSKVIAGGFEYLAAIFSTDGSPSINTKSALKFHQQKYLESIETNAFNKSEFNGSILNYFLNLISFQINFDNAAAALLLPIKLNLKHSSNSAYGESTEALHNDRIHADQLHRQNRF